MRNLKRVLSLALASVMLFGMMVIGTSAAGTNFADDADIVNTEAAAITAGLGIFAGADGKFLPNETVTRAQMATIIVKMLYGSSFNADPFKGIGEFKDVAGYQGGWAEGYINLCESMGIVSGYGDNTFKPGNPVTTAEAVTMIINALNVDAGKGTWPATVMAKATEIKLFGDKIPSTNEGLTRDDLSVLVLNGIKYSPAAGSTGDWAFNPNTNQWVQRPGTATDSLANKVFGLQSALGVVTDNQATGAKTTKINTATVVDGKITAVAADATVYNVETGLDMIGRVVTVYYKTTGEKGTVYAVVDESKVVTVGTAISSSATKMATAFGKGTDDAAAVVNFADYAGTVGTAINGFTKDASAAKGTYALYGGQIVTYVAPAANIGVVSKVINYTAPTAKANGSIEIAGLKADGTIGTAEVITLQKIGSTTEDVVKLYDGIKKDHYVYVTKVGANAAVVEKAEIVTAAIEGKTNDNGKITLAGTTYSVASVGTAGMVTANNTTKAALGLTDITNDTVPGTTVYNVVKTSDGKVLGYYSYTPASAANDYAVVQGVAVTGATGADTWSSTTFKPATAQVKLALADGTSAVYSIKMTTDQTKLTTEADVKTALGLTDIAAQDIVKIAVADGVITEIKEQTVVSGTAVKNGSTLITGAAGKYLTADSVVIYWNPTDTTNWKITKFVGYNTLKTAADTTVKAVVNSSNQVVFAYVATSGVSDTTATTKAFIPSMAYTVRYDAAAKANRYDYTAFVDGEKVTLTAKSAITPTGTAAAPYVASYTIKNGYLDSVAYLAAGSAKDQYVAEAISYMTSDIVVAAGVEYTYANAKAFIVSKDLKTVTATEVMKAAADSYDTYLVVKTAAGTKVADLAYIYYIAKN